VEVVVGLPRNPKTKIVTPAKAAAHIRRWKQTGRRAVFTNGCFDILHSGHARYLFAARKLGEALVVGINSDESIRRIKGDKRPILSQQERAELIASLECVDLVVIFPEDDPGRLIAKLQPHVLVKGADWTKDKIVGSEVVKKLGGKVFTVPLVKGRSTSNVIETILERYA
jgi:D-beta-D-heptose 7-phosphate kinase/D-beta-D-heptose 1-phosphate adenosyltransferase